MKNGIIRELKIFGWIMIFCTVIFSFVSGFNFTDTIDIGIEGVDLTIYPLYIVFAFSLIIYLIRIILSPFIWVVKKLVT